MQLSLKEWSAINKFAQSIKMPGHNARLTKKMAKDHYKKLPVEKREKFLKNIESNNKGANE